MNQPKHIAYAFQASLKNIALKDIQTMHPFPEGIRESVKFKSILASVEEMLLSRWLFMQKTVSTSYWTVISVCLPYKN